jgi:hypothetical protein
MNTQLHLLKILLNIHPRLMATGTLWSELLLADDRCGYAGFKTALRELEEKGQVVLVTGEDRDKCKITDAGIARLAEVGI